MTNSQDEAGDRESETMKDAWNLLVRVRETVISTNLPSLNQIEGI
jgi:hypothetical protein